jgi:protein phosphatase-4 regulatory subunit 3
VYVLNADRNWDDKGTGHVTFDALRPALIVHSETQEDNGKILLNSDILLSTGYQKQQETLIVWAESDTCDLALSFQAKAGCDEIWSKICEVWISDNFDQKVNFVLFAGARQRSEH